MTIHQSPTVPRRAALAVATLIVSLAAVAGGVAGASPASADGGYPCRVLEKSGDKVIGQVYYQDGDVIETKPVPSPASTGPSRDPTWTLRFPAKPAAPKTSRPNPGPSSGPGLLPRRAVGAIEPTPVPGR